MSSPLRICLDLRFLQRACENSAAGGLGGVGVYSANLWRAFAELRDQVTLTALVMPRPLARRFRDILELVPEARLVTRGLIGRRSIPSRISFGSYAPLLHFLENELPSSLTFRAQFDIMHTLDHSLKPRCAATSVATIHDIPLKKPDTWIGRFAWFCFRRTVLQAKQIACVSKATAEELLRAVPEARGKITVCLNGIDVAVFRPGPTEPDRIARRFALTSPFFLHVGICTKRKNPDGILEATARAALIASANFKFVFAGPYHLDTTAAAYIRSRAAELGISDRIIIIGDVPSDELVLLYRQASGLVFPSFLEGFGFPPIEALACGAPCIVSRAGAVAEIVGELGLHVDPNQPGEIASLMVRLLNEDPPSDLATRGVALAERYSTSVMARSYLEVYRTTLSSADAERCSGQPSQSHAHR
jgi:glycosyltransferase involved in cell wall biosynthesis